ncbi:aspartate kinase [Dysgonomonas sp. 216]|uniref:aspartate kinase n=1 Tax=Dysgonomonas sp. 216 TaxID=2302934 RepID=UPI0013D7938E|nr:aspartate kinase [Dysgonomonas sp. 216]NDW19344.1 aspartate kinase [Dysgonomonas sp. 216]
MKVLKFGGKSIATTERLKFVANIAAQNKKNIVIVPAMPGITVLLEDISDYLYKKNQEAANETITKLQKELMAIVNSLFANEKSVVAAIELINSKIDYIRSFGKNLFTLFEEKIILAQGELISSHLFYLYTQERGLNSVELSALDFMLIDKNHEPDTDFIKEKLTALVKDKAADLYITQGYICKNIYGEIDDFRKGGNDYSATLTGAAIDADEIQIWTDVEELKNIDSSVVSKAKTIKDLSFDEAAELAYFGDKILHPTSILPAKLANIPVRILSVMTPESDGTLISFDAEKGIIKAVAAKDDITAITIKSGRMLLAHGFLRRVFEVFEHHETSIDMLTSSEVGISITIDNSRNLGNIIDDLKKYGSVSVNTNMTLVSVIGDMEWKNTQTKTKVMNAIKDLPVCMISYGGSDYNFSFLIKKDDKTKTLKTLNDNLF